MKKIMWAKAVDGQINELNRRYRMIEEDDVGEILNFKALVERNILPVMGHIKFDATKTIAENINSQIQKIVTVNQGTREREFFYFRLKKYFT